MMNASGRWACVAILSGILVGTLTGVGSGRASGAEQPGANPGSPAPIATVGSATVEKAVVHRYDDAEVQKSDWGTLHWLLNAKKEPGAEMTVGIVELKPRSSNPLHIHPNSAEYLHVLEGSCEHRLGDKWVPMKAGDTLRVPKGVLHMARAGDQGCRSIVMYDTGNRQMVVVEEAQAPGTAPIGAAKIDITPETPVRMYGYASRKKESEGVAGRLKASALAIGGDAGEGPAVLLTVDCGAVPADVRAEVLRRLQGKLPLKPERFMLANAHNHSGPDLKGMGSMSGTDLEHLTRYKKELTDKLEQVVLKALAARKPGRLARAEGSVGFAANRRVLKDGKWSGFGAVPEGAVDHSLPLLKVTDAQGKLLAVVVNYACHNTTLRGDFMGIHGDWAGCAQAYVEADNPGAVAMITIGCGADSDPCPHSTVALCEKHGRAMADEVKRVLAGPFQPVEPRIAARMTTLEIPFAPLPSLDELKRQAKNSYSAERLVRLLERGEKPPVKREYPLATWIFGNDLAMVFLSNEVVVDYALRMKRELDGRRLWINAYSNDVSNYIVSKRLIKEGGYEPNNSLSATVTYGHPEQLQPAMEDRIVEAVRGLLPESFRTPGK